MRSDRTFRFALWQKTRLHDVLQSICEELVKYGMNNQNQAADKRSNWATRKGVQKQITVVNVSG